MTEHVQRNYVKIWAMLCALLVVSILGPLIGIRMLTLIAAFGVAIVKAFLVAKHFMHLDIEKRWVAYVLLAMIGFIVVMFAGIAPDVMKHDGLRWENTAAKQAVGSGGGVGAGGHR
ncbi:MAG: cytochrome C oxidase subunit IV family protein [Acidobacteria bacterium]|nr:cytochrome C oxidase subunit IV family protein [Acidobacteriota bacterium]